MGLRTDIYWRFVKAANAVLDRVEPWLADKSDRPLRFAPIFIIGAPRSGSTLLCQVLTESLEVGYLCNLHAKYFGGPSIVERFAHPLRNREPSSFKSDHGWVLGPAAPSEAGEFWYRFFQRKPQYVADADPKQMRRLRGAIRAFGNACGKPILFKNMPCALRLMPLARALPEALFLVLRRDLLENARSILETRIAMCGDYNAWWSLEPPAIEELKSLPPHAQAVEQVRHITALIERDRQRLRPDRFLDLDYEELCARPEAVVQTVIDFLKRHRISVQRRGVIPTAFRQNKDVRIDKSLHEQLVTYARQQS